MIQTLLLLAVGAMIATTLKTKTKSHEKLNSKSIAKHTKIHLANLKEKLESDINHSDIKFRIHDIRFGYQMREDQDIKGIA